LNRKHDAVQFYSIAFTAATPELFSRSTALLRPRLRERISRKITGSPDCYVSLLRVVKTGFCFLSRSGREWLFESVLPLDSNIKHEGETHVHKNITGSGRGLGCNCLGKWAAATCRVILVNL